MSIGEEEICKYLIKNKIFYNREVRFPTCKDVQPLPFDFAIYKNNEINCLIEYQGEQHYVATGGWSNEEQLTYIQKHDELKRQWAKENNIPLYEIPYWEFENIEMILNKILNKVGDDK
jgi:hypothetical protein